MSRQTRGEGRALAGVKTAKRARQTSRRARSAGWSAPETFVDRAGLVFQQRPDDLDGPLPRTQHDPARQVHCQVFRVRANDLAKIALRQPVNDPPNPCPVGRSGTHRARLGAAVQRAPGQEFRRVGKAGTGHEQPLRMPGAVAAVAVRVTCLHQDGPVSTHQDRSERMVPARSGRTSNLNRQPKVFLVGLQEPVCPV